MFHRLKRHPFAVSAHFDHCLVLAYALPRETLQPMLAPGLELDVYQNFGFVAVALVQTRALRPSFLPAALGQNFFLVGYRIFTRYQSRAGRNLRGLQILRSDTDKPLMKIAGNLFTHYNYQSARTRFELDDQTLEIETRATDVHLSVVADLSQPAPLPNGSPFPDIATARRYAGPLPYTFDYERQTRSMILVKGVRKKWNPMPVEIEVRANTFFDDERFGGATPILANAFYLSDVPYRWEPGKRETVSISRRDAPRREGKATKTTETDSAPFFLFRHSHFPLRAGRLRVGRAI